MRKPVFIDKTEDIVAQLSEIVGHGRPDKIFIITDSNVNRLLSTPETGLTSLVEELQPEVLVFSAGESNKNIAAVCELWRGLSERGATRRSLVINIGGGVTTDMGGFVASTFKRGLRYINIPTSLLAMVDASVGGKTGIDFEGLKNEIGVFSQPIVTIIAPAMLETLPKGEILSGMAEVAKTAMIADKKSYIDLLQNFAPDSKLIRMCVEEKFRITEIDPREQGLRKILNFGHTAGHAFESMLLARNVNGITHGLCVAHGILVALILSHFKLGLSSDVIHNYRQRILAEYPPLPVSCNDIDELIRLMHHDKKNRSGEIRYVLLRDIANPLYDQAVTEPELRQALELKCDM